MIRFFQIVATKNHSANLIHVLLIRQDVTYVPEPQSDGPIYELTYDTMDCIYVCGKNYECLLNHDRFVQRRFSFRVSIESESPDRSFRIKVVMNCLELPASRKQEASFLCICR
mmetsp:Transcript_9997/g.18158  ORF Transcript_9997/g.18158 Transcript_9997/m.18158 type:complete len:113 (+) Transcript_9997:1037-1375(+)